MLNFKSKRRYLYILLIFIIIFVSLEVTFRVLQRPNIIDVDDDHPFLLKTAGHQIGDYAKFVEYDSDAGCWAVAIAQIAHYHRLIPSGKIEYQTSQGHKILVNLDDYTFRYDLFVPGLNEQTSDVSIEQVAKYIYFVAALLHTNFGGSGYLHHETMMSRIESHLGCTVSFYEFAKERFLTEKFIT